MQSRNHITYLEMYSFADEQDNIQVSIVSTENRDLKAAVKMAVDAIGGVRRALTPGDRVLLKPNFNSDDPFPASTDLGFLKAVSKLRSTIRVRTQRAT